MRKLITHVVLIFCCSQAFAQRPKDDYIDDFVEEIGWGEFSTQFHYERPAREIKGEYYLFHDWVVADIDLYADEKFKGKRLNLNLLTGDIEVPIGDRTRILDKFKIKSIVVGDRKFVNSLHLDRSSYRNTFFEVVEEGAINVYCQYYSFLRQPSYGVPGSGGDRDYTSIIRKTYFVQSGSIMEMFSNSKKTNMEYFLASSPTVEYIGKEKLRINKIKSFVKATRFYNINN